MVRSWVSSGNARYIAALTTYGVCAVFSTDAQAEAVRHVLQSDPVFRKSERLTWSFCKASMSIRR